jgi:hypothetical protein
MGFLEPSHQVKSRQVSSFLAKLFRGRHDSTGFLEKVNFSKILAYHTQNQDASLLGSLRTTRKETLPPHFDQSFDLENFFGYLHSLTRAPVHLTKSLTKSSIGELMI